MAKASATDPDQLVVDALSKAIRQRGEIRLLTFGKSAENAGLFKDDKTAARKAAIETCLSEEKPLLRVVRTETVKNAEHRFVAVTPHGMEFVLARLAPNLAVELLRSTLTLETEQIPVLESEWARTVQVCRGNLENLQNLVGAYAQCVSSTVGRIEADVREVRERSQGLRSKLDDLLKSVSVPSGGVDDQPLPHDDTAQRRTGTIAARPSSEEDYSFLRQLARQMVLAWKQTADPSAKEVIERALFNAGISRIGKKDEKVPFVSRLHECPDSPGVFPDDPVQILLPGWQLTDDKGEYLLAKALVKALPA